MKKLITFLLFLNTILFSRGDTFYMTIPALTIYADDIIEGIVVDVWAEWDEQHRFIHSKTIIKVEKSYKNFIKENEVTIDEMGGKIGKFLTTNNTRAIFF